MAPVADIDATLQFLGPCYGRPCFHERQLQRDNLPLVGHRVRVLDRRASTGRPTLAIEGFELLNWPTRVTDVVTPAGRRAHAREIEALIIEHTGALTARTLGGGVVRRSEHAPRYRQDGTTVPGRFVHCDFATGTDPDWVRQQLPPDQAASNPTGRIAIFNVWRSLSPPPQDAPLALCDRRSVDARDRVVADQVIDRRDAPERRIEIELLRFAESQAWSFYSNMTPDEVILFAGFDTAAPGGVPHGAFDGPSVNGRPRESIDERVIAVFG